MLREMRRLFAWMLTLTFFLGAAGNLRAQEPEQVLRAINRGIDFLKSKQRADGRWDEFPGAPGGIDALATLALLSCDVPVDNPKIQASLKYLRQLPPENTYVTSLQTMVFALADSKRDFALIRRNANWLMQTRLPDGRWTYGSQGRGSGDNSNTQFALLGLQAAADVGFEVPEQFWSTCRNYWTRSQGRMGSWGYPSTEGASGSMTAAGISSLIITSRELLDVEKGTVNGKPVLCDGAKSDPNLQAAIDWVGRNFSVDNNPGGSNSWLYYYLYGLERAGRLSGRRFFGDHDWYRRGVSYLVGRQQVSGSWNIPGGNRPAEVINTSFALLFLSKGRIPILVNKLKHPPRNDWNNAPNDINNLTDFLAKRWNVKLNWQVVDINVATVEDLLQAPVLHISGHDAPVFTPQEKERLRGYISQGGLIMADANCSVTNFDIGFRELCAELFPEPEQQLRRLEPEHGVWTSLFNLTDLSNSHPLYGIDLGCRTAVIYSPGDLSCQWEYFPFKEHQERTLGGMRLGANIVAYATGPENLQDKLVERKIIPEAEEDEIRRNFLQVAKIRHNGEWNPAPRAISNLMESLQQVAKIDVIRQQRPIEILDPNFVNYPLCYMHGRTRFQLSRPEIEALSSYLASGGVLFADACCGSERFDEAFRQMIKELFPGEELRPIPPEHELYTREIGYDLSKVEMDKALGNRSGPPLLEGLEVQGRYVVIYSKYDLGCALERQQSSDCKGYTHDSAIKIATNIALYALKQ